MADSARVSITMNAIDIMTKTNAKPFFFFNIIMTCIFFDLDFIWLLNRFSIHILFYCNVNGYFDFTKKCAMFLAIKIQCFY